jgi:hypothetical protein
MKIPTFRRKIFGGKFSTRILTRQDTTIIYLKTVNSFTFCQKTACFVDYIFGDFKQKRTMWV